MCTRSVSHCLAYHNDNQAHESIMAPSKRPHEVIDLTGSSPVRPKSKHARTTASSSQGHSSSSNGRPSQSYPGSQRSGHHPSSSSRIVAHGQGQRLASQQNDPFLDDEPDLIDLTQADEGPIFGLYGKINNKIVGVRYYNGIVSPGEVVILRREPTNP